MDSPDWQYSGGCKRVVPLDAGMRAEVEPGANQPGNSILKPDLTELNRQQFFRCLTDADTGIFLQQYQKFD